MRRWIKFALVFAIIIFSPAILCAASGVTAITLTNVPAANYNAGSTNNLVLQIALSVTGNDTLTSFTTQNIGTATDQTDFQNVKLWLQTTGGTFNAGTATLISALTYSGGTWSVTGLSQQVSNGNSLYVSVDIPATATNSRTLQFELTSSSVVFIKGGAFPASTLANTSSQTIIGNTTPTTTPTFTVSPVVSPTNTPTISPVLSRTPTPTITQTVSFVSCNISFDSVSSYDSDNAQVSSATFSHTIASGTNSLLLVQVNIYGTPSVTSATYAGIAMTPALIVTSASNPNTDDEEIWYMLNPPGGTNNVVINASAAIQMQIGAISYFGVNQLNPIGATATAFNTALATNPSNPITTLRQSSAIVNMLVYYGKTGTITNGPGQAQRWIANNISDHIWAEGDDFFTGTRGLIRCHTIFPSRKNPI